MKTNILPALRLSLVMVIIIAFIYPVAIYGLAQLQKDKGEGAKIMVDGKVVGYQQIGQAFNQTKYFHSRPSAVDYNGAGSGGSNKGPTNPTYLADVQERIVAFEKENPTVKKSEIPSEMVTASGSGLDPQISLQAALVQIDRIASVRNIDKEKVKKLVVDVEEKPLLGLFGPSTVNVLILNTQLDTL
ncbi:MAG: potassium-transporting ATPase subunit KdpC [Pelobium sp.]